MTPATSAVDACPGLLALHPARDGLVARIRLPGGYLSGPRLRALAALADDFGDGRVDVTARGNVQLRGISGDRAEALASAASRARLLPSAAHDRARNIMASPLAGLAGRPPLRHLVARLDAALLADPVFAALPGRFLFSLDDGSGGAGLASCDVGVLRGDVVVAGRLTGVRGAGVSGTGVAGTGVAGTGVAGTVAVVAAAARAALALGVGAAVGRVADLPDGGAAVAAAIGGALGPPAAAQDTRLPLGPSHRAGTDHDEETLVIGAPLGRLTVSQLRLIASLLRAREVVRLGIAGRLVVPLAAGAAAGAGALAAGALAAGALAAGALAGAGLLVSGDEALADVTACSGAACARALADVRALARPVGGHARTHWAGCARQCGRPPDAEPVVAVDADHFLLAGQPLAKLVP